MKAVREKGKKDVFFFLGKDWRVVVLCGGSRSAAVSALGYRYRRKAVCAQLRHGRKTQLVEGGGLWPNPAYPAYRP